MQHIQFPQRPEDNQSLRIARQILRNYWSEGEAYLISRDQVAQLSVAAAEISRLFREGIDNVIRQPKLLEKFVFLEDAAMNNQLHTLIKESWRTNPSYVLDRWDLAWDGVHPPQILERNFGWVGLLVASGKAQEEYGNWLSAQGVPGEIFDGRLNGECMDASIIRAFQQVAAECGLPAGGSIITVAEEHDGDPEMFISGLLLSECVEKAGYQSIWKDRRSTHFENGYAFRKRSIPPLTLNQAKAQELKALREGFKLRELANIFGGDVSPFMACKLAEALEKIAARHKGDPNFCFKWPGSCEPERFDGWIFPYYGFSEFAEQAAAFLKDNPCAELYSKTLTPYWALLADHKGMLAVLHEMFPQSPYIPPTYWGSAALQGQKRVIKEALGCQGENAIIFNENNDAIADRRDGRVGKHYVTQAYCDAVHDAEGRFKVVNLFTANDVPAAIGTRVAPGPFVGGNGTQTRYVPVLVYG